MPAIRPWFSVLSEPNYTEFGQEIEIDDRYSRVSKYLVSFRYEDDSDASGQSKIEAKFRTFSTLLWEGRATCEESLSVSSNH